jgi:hypothetical protein
VSEGPSGSNICENRAFTKQLFDPAQPLDRPIDEQQEEAPQEKTTGASSLDPKKRSASTGHAQLMIAAANSLHHEARLAPLPTRHV